MHDDREVRSVPAWRALGEGTSIGERLVATAGMLPILQAPADDNDTV